MAVPSSAPSTQVNVPKLNRDPIQSLCPFSIIVNVQGWMVEIPALPAVDWLTVLMVEDLDLDNIFPGLLNPEDEGVVDELIMSGELDVDEFQDILLSIVETASARNWWVALRLIEMARTSWDVLGGEMALRGVDATRISLAAWLDVVLLIALRNTEPEKARMFCARLEAPPPQIEAEDPEPEMSVSQFMAMSG